jgi:hypothetical protein
MADTLLDLITLELAIYWGLNGKTRSGEVRKEHGYHVPMGAIKLFTKYKLTADHTSSASLEAQRLLYADSSFNGLVRLYQHL